MGSLGKLAAKACLACLMALPAGAQSRWQPQKTMVLVASLTTWPGAPELAASSQPRKDDEFVRQLIGAGVPEDNIIILKDQRATRQGLQQALSFLAGRASPGHTLMLYFQGHGSQQGLFCFDYKHSQEEGLLKLGELPSLLREFRGNRLILMGDSRCSGKLASVVEQFSRQRPQLKVLALASAAATSQSRANWTYTQALCRVLAGDPSLDQNADQRLSQPEVEHFLHRQMKYLENQKSGLYLSASFEKDFIWRKTTGKAVAKAQGPYQVGNLLWAQDTQGKWWPCEILKVQKGGYQVRLHDPDGPRAQEVDAQHLRPFPKTHLEVGQTYELLSHHRAVTLIRSFEDYFYLAHPLTEAGEGDEWVTADDLRALPKADPAKPNISASPTSPPPSIPWDPEIRPPMDSLPPTVGDRVAARWRKNWYRAQVIGRSQGGYRLRYDDNSSGQATASEVIPMASARPFQAGDRVLACASPDGRMLTGTIIQVVDGRVRLRWDHPPPTSSSPLGEAEIEMEKLARIRPQP